MPEILTTQFIGAGKAQFHQFGFAFIQHFLRVVDTNEPDVLVHAGVHADHRGTGGTAKVINKGFFACMVGGQFGYHALHFSVKGNRTVYHIVKNLGYIGPEFKVAGFFYFVLKNFIFAHIRYELRPQSKAFYTGVNQPAPGMYIGYEKSLPSRQLYYLPGHSK